MNNMGNCITSSKEAYHPDEHLSNTLRGLPPTNLELKKRMELADVLKADKAMRKDGDPWFVVEAAWVHRWLAYVQGNDKMKHPGPIDNSNLLLPPNSEDPRWKPKPVLRAARKEHMGHYRRINHKVWELWQNTYVGSGPAIWVKTEPFENVANWEIEPGLTGEQTTVAPVGRGQGAQGNAGNGAGREEPSRLWPPSSQE